MLKNMVSLPPYTFLETGNKKFELHMIVHFVTLVH